MGSFASGKEGQGCADTVLHSLRQHATEATEKEATASRRAQACLCPVVWQEQVARPRHSRGRHPGL